MKKISESQSQQSIVNVRLLKVLRSPFWVCVLLAVLARAWLIVHTNGVLAGDEAMVGIQAENILRGEHPIYYYSQPYMASLQAHFIAAIFLVTGPSVWALRIEPLLISLFIVFLTWRFSSALADAARLTARGKILFMMIASLVAALPPLYDAVEEMRTTGGYVEAFAIMLWLLLCAFRLTLRWRAGASARELALRWAGIGFLVGLGFWIDPLIIYAVVTITVWIAGFVLFKFIQPQHKNVARERVALLTKALLVTVAIPFSLIGFAPGLYWGVHNQWANIRYLFQKGGTVPHGRLYTTSQVQHVYTSCLALRAIGGALPTQPDVTPANPHILTFSLVVGLCSLGICATGILLSLFWPHPLLLRLRQLTLLPMLFCLSASIIFCTASIAVDAIRSGCTSVDLVGRYVVPLVIALPFFISAVLTIPAMIAQEKKTISPQTMEYTGDTPSLLTKPSSGHLSPLTAIQAGLLAVLLAYFCLQAVAYVRADPNYTFQVAGCSAANPTDVDPLIHSMQQAGIRYAWATGWLGDPITFKTNEAILVTEPHGRIPSNSNIVLRAARPSILVLAHHGDPHPAFLHALDARHIAYHIQRFYAAAGVDALIVTPLNQTVSPLDPYFTALFHRVFFGCLI